MGKRNFILGRPPRFLPDPVPSASALPADLPNREPNVLQTVLVVTRKMRVRETEREREERRGEEGAMEGRKEGLVGLGRRGAKMRGENEGRGTQWRGK